MSKTFILSANEARVIELLRELKVGGHGTLRIEVRDGIESLFRPERSELPPVRK
jgi:hypothetical protein